MSTTKIEEDSHLLLEYGPYPRATRVRAFVESDVDVDTYAVEAEDLDAFNETGEISEAFDYREDRQNHQLSFEVPAHTVWYLLIVNWSNEVAAVHYKVQTLKRGH